MGKATIRYGIVGVKGFSSRHVLWLRRAREAGADVELAAVATIERDEAALKAGAELAAEGVKVVESYADLLALKNDIDVITLPVGIHLHVPLAKQALEAGFSVYMEKPAAGSVEAVADLMRAEKKAAGRLFVGFQTLYQGSTWQLKRSLLAGAIGKVKKIVITGIWRRTMVYFTRNRWAGKLSVDGQYIYDCAINNAMGHFLNTALFLAGDSEEASAAPAGVEAELYRAAPIESADNNFLRIRTRNGVEVVFNATLSCRSQEDATIDVIGDRGRIEIVDKQDRLIAPWRRIDASGAAVTEAADAPADEVFAQVARAMRDPGVKEICTLANAALPVAANQMSFLATPIRDIPEIFLVRESLKDEDNVDLVTVKGIDETLRALRPGGNLPHEIGGVDWAGPSGAFDGAQAAALLAKIGV